MVTCFQGSEAILASAIEVTYYVKFGYLFPQSLKTLFKAFLIALLQSSCSRGILRLNLSISLHFHTVYTDQPHLSGLNEFKILMRF